MSAGFEGYEPNANGQVDEAIIMVREHLPWKSGEDLEWILVDLEREAQLLDPCKMTLPKFWQVVGCDPC